VRVPYCTDREPEHGACHPRTNRPIAASSKQADTKSPGYIHTPAITGGTTAVRTTSVRRR
jgi:hypothetical protein